MFVTSTSIRFLITFRFHLSIKTFLWPDNPNFEWWHGNFRSMAAISLAFSSLWVKPVTDCPQTADLIAFLVNDDTLGLWQLAFVQFLLVINFDD